ncbi:MAG TPA: redox-sensing transcriptional repressor Rex [Bacteroides sp.]|nr:redox-sensing transcriptional repressor Rex [Bacteroides sp.]
MISANRNIRRLLRYRNSLCKMQELGFETVYSYNLGRETGVSPEQVRKDFSQFGIKGNKKGGYNINELLITIREIFRKDELQKVIVVGVGNIGNAILQYKGFQKNMIEIVASFDIDPTKYKKKKLPVPVYSLDKLPKFVVEHKINTAIMTVPERVAQDVADLLIEAGIKGIMNFAPTVLKVPPHIHIVNICIGHELESLIYHSLQMGNNGRGKGS